MSLTWWPLFFVYIWLGFLMTFFLWIKVSGSGFSSVVKFLILQISETAICWRTLNHLVVGLSTMLAILDSNIYCCWSCRRFKHLVWWLVVSRFSFDQDTCCCGLFIGTSDWLITNSTRNVICLIKEMIVKGKRLPIFVLLLLLLLTQPWIGIWVGIFLVRLILIPSSLSRMMRRLGSFSSWLSCIRSHISRTKLIRVSILVAKSFLRFSLSWLLFLGIPFICVVAKIVLANIFVWLHWISELLLLLQNWLVIHTILPFC